MSPVLNSNLILTMTTTRYYSPLALTVWGIAMLLGAAFYAANTPWASMFCCVIAPFLAALVYGRGIIDQRRTEAILQLYTDQMRDQFSRAYRKLTHQRTIRSIQVGTQYLPAGTLNQIAFRALVESGHTEQGALRMLGFSIIETKYLLDQR